MAGRRRFGHKGTGREPGDNTDSRPFTAQYTSPCAGDCGDDIEPGEEVSYVDDELMHIDCQPVRRRVAEKAPCNKCFLVHGTGQKECE